MLDMGWNTPLSSNGIYIEILAPIVHEQDCLEVDYNYTVLVSTMHVAAQHHDCGCLCARGSLF